MFHAKKKKNKHIYIGKDTNPQYIIILKTISIIYTHIGKHVDTMYYIQKKKKSSTHTSLSQTPKGWPVSFFPFSVRKKTSSSLIIKYFTMIWKWKNVLQDIFFLLKKNMKSAWNFLSGIEQIFREQTFREFWSNYFNLNAGRRKFTGHKKLYFFFLYS